MNIDKTIFRAYDIRGIVGKGLNADLVYLLGKALGSVTLEHGDKSLIVARDGRLSAEELSHALHKGIVETGCDVIDIGMVPTPLVYYATHVMDTHSGVMLTGSHNPAEYNGLKMVVNGKTLAQDQIQALYQRVLDNDFSHGMGSVFSLEITERYIGHVNRNVKLKKPLKVVVDGGNGVGGLVAPALYKLMGCEVIEIFCDVDGSFPNHHPDPSQVENLQDLIQKVKETNADIGLAFDGDSDRLGVVSANGEVIWPDRQLMLLAKPILAKYPGTKIIYDVKCSSNLAKVITALGGEPLMWKTGHSLIKAKLAETQAMLAGEMSGHLFLRDRWYGFDDAIYAGARILEILSNLDTGPTEWFADIPDSVNTPELKVFVSETEKFGLMEKIISKANFNSAQVTTIDGLRVNFSDGWGLVRPSNTTPCLVLRFEAESKSVLTKIQNIFKEFLLDIEPSLELPF